MVVFLFLIRADLKIGWHLVLNAVDACNSVLGISAASSTLEIIKEMGVWNERWRFKLDENFQARENAFKDCECQEFPELHFGKSLLDIYFWKELFGKRFSETYVWEDMFGKWFWSTNAQHLMQCVHASPLTLTS